MKTPTICLVTNGRTAEGNFEWARDAARAGVDLIQIREPALDDRALLAMVRGAIAAAAGTPARIVVNDRLDVAMAAGAAGVHLRASSFPCPAARLIAPAGLLIGRSVHSLREAIGVERLGGCDYLIFGTVFASASKPGGHAVAGIEALREVCAGVRLPVIAIGGITPDTAGQAAQAGAAGVAGIGVFANVRDVPAAVAELRRSIDSSSGRCLK